MKVSANVATHKPRRSVLPKMLRSIKDQVDVVRCYCNDYKDSALESEFEDVEFYYGDDLTDRGKFYGIQEGEIAFTCDDDILYDPHYVERTLDALDRYPNAIVTYHGRKLQGRGRNYYFGHKSYHCLRPVEGNYMIDVPGSGVSAWDTSKFMPDILKYEEDCMADVLLALEAAKQDVDVICLEHSAFLLKSLWNPSKGSIFRNYNNDCERQSELADKIWDIKNGE